MTFGQTLREARIRRGLSQDQLATAMSKHGTPISKPYLSRIENDKRPPSLDLIPSFAELLDLVPEFLFALAGEFPPGVFEQLRQSAVRPSPAAVHAAWDLFVGALAVDAEREDLLSLSVQITERLLDMNPEYITEVTEALNVFAEAVQKGRVGRPPRPIAAKPLK